MVSLVFVGSPLLDITARCSKELLKRFGLRSDDCVKATDHHDVLFQQLVKDPNTELSSGGSAQNSARVAKWIAGNRAEVSFIGCTGNDAYDVWLRDKLTSDGVRPLYVQHPVLKTGVCACLVSGEDERSMITRHEAAATLCARHLALQPQQESLRRAHCVYVEGYVIGHSPDVVLALADKFSDTQMFSLSLSAEYICSDYSSQLLQLMPHVDVLFGNEAELKAFTAALGAAAATTVEDCISEIRQAKELRNNPSMILIVTRGSNSVVVSGGTGDTKYFPVPSDISMVDSVGCGDALAGGFLAAFALTKNLDISVKIGIRAATEIAQVKGCNLPHFKIFNPDSVDN